MSSHALRQPGKIKQEGTTGGILSPTLFSPVKKIGPRIPLRQPFWKQKKRSMAFPYTSPHISPTCSPFNKGKDREMLDITLKQPLKT